MVLFKKKRVESNLQPAPSQNLPELPKLPELPRLDLPQVSPLNDRNSNNLPSFPNNDLGRKISQDTIKGAITGEEEDDEAFEDEEFDEQYIGSPPKSFSMPIKKEYPHPHNKNGPVFVRLDKFQESIHIFENAKTQIMEMEHLLMNIRKRKDDESYCG